MDGSFEHTWQYGKLQRQLNSLIVAHLRDCNLSQAAMTVASATMTPLNMDEPPNRLLELLAKGLAVERDETMRVGAASTLDFDSHVLLPAAYGSNSSPAAVPTDFSALQDVKGSSKNFPRHETRHICEHKEAVRCAKFSPDGKFIGTGSSDTFIKLFEVSKIKHTSLGDSMDGPSRPIVRTFYDTPRPINDLDFHPQSPILISGSKDNTIKFYDFSKPATKRANRIIQDTHSVRSVSFHPSGDFLLAGTDHPIPHLYDVATFQCYLSSTAPETPSRGAINQVRYSSTGGMYVTASKDGGVRVWDGVSASIVHDISDAHGGVEATSSTFSKDQRFVLSCGKDSAARLWDTGSGKLVKQFLGASHSVFRCQAVFDDTEEFVLSIDEAKNEIVAWDVLTGDKVIRWPSKHAGPPRWIEHSPVDAEFVTCGTDRSMRHWRTV